ncbi:elastinolytic metalloproteinase Mep, partial [Candidatus Thiomargarita nelsonii]
MKFEKYIRFLSGAILLLYALILNSVVAAPNQEKALEIALNYLNENQAFLGLSQADLSDKVVKDQYVTQHNGVTHIYLRQEYNGIELFNGDIAIHIAKDGSVIKVNNQFVPNLSQAVNTTKPFISAIQAVQSTAQHLGLNLTTDLVIQENLGGTEKSVILTGGGISLDDIPAKLVYEQVSQGEVRLAWLVRVRQHEHWWNLRIDAVTGKVLSKNDWIVNDNDYKVFPLPSI